jgi:hypothetical protein
MGLDISRNIFDPLNDYFGVVMEQGRPQLDSDWNEWVQELNRRIQAGTLDIVGRAVVPATTPNAFAITANAGQISIGAGRMYVDGILVENHGNFDQWDPALTELSGAPQIAGVAPEYISFRDQFYMRGAALPTGNGPFLVYLDVWRREITAQIDTNIVDPAIAVDSSGRVQTVWQVKLLDVSTVTGGVTCSTPDADIPAWAALIAPSAGQLTNGVTSSTPMGPCCIGGAAGYTGLENQFYRVQIHQGGTLDTATFKWSRENGSVTTAVSGISAVINSAGNPASQLAVTSLGRDQVLGFVKGNWIELIDDQLELAGQPGELHLIDSVDSTANTITLDSVVSAVNFPVINAQTDPTRHTRVIRWDQAGIISQADGTPWGATPVGNTGIPVPPAGTTLVLESGLTVAFGLNPGTGAFQTGDYWNFAARTGGVPPDPLLNAYPRGIHHHYARLAVVTFPNTVSDCRVPWPAATGGGADCCCSVTVQPGDITGAVTLQSIIDKYKGSTNPISICLAAGTFNLPAPLRFGSAYAGIGLKACQPGSVNLQAQAGQESEFADGVIVLDNVAGISLAGLYVAVPVVNFATGGSFAGQAVTGLDPDVQAIVNNLVVSIGVRAVNCPALSVTACEFGFADFTSDIPTNAVPFGVGIFGTGQCTGWTVSETTFGGIGPFIAGVLVAPQASFAQPAAAPSAARNTETEKVSIGRTAKNFSLEATKAPVPQVTEQALLQNPIIGGGLGENPVIKTGGVWGGGPTGSATGLAARGGTVLVTTLDQAVFEQNVFSGTTVAVLAMGATAKLQFSGNTVNSAAGLWVVSPLQANLLPFDGNDIAMTALAIAIGYPLPQNDTTLPASLTTVPAAPAPVRIYAGAKAFTDSLGNVWLPDAGAATVTVTGGKLNQPANPATITGALPGATDEALYQSERWGQNFSYSFNKLTPGFYQITLKFAEITWTNPANDIGHRIFDVSINGTAVLQGLDIVAQAGPDWALDYVFSNVQPNAENAIEVTFTGTSAGPDPNAKIAAVDLEPQWNGVMPAFFTSGSALAAAGPVVTFYYQLCQLSQEAYTIYTSTPLNLRVTDNEMPGLVSAGVLILGNDAVLTPNTSALIMTGNRVFNSIAVRFEPTEYDSLGGGAYYFATTTTIAGVTRCVLSTNMLNNAAGVYDVLGSCLLINDYQGAPLTATVPAPALIISGNLFKGRLLIYPPRYSENSNVPYPMNSWDFLNTLEH